MTTDTAPPNRLIDTHAHLQLEQFDADREAVIARAQQAGVETIIVVSTDLASSRQSLALAEKHAGLFAAVGFHPNDCGAAGDDDFVEIARLAQHPKVVAIGEIGMDFHWQRVPAEVQQRAFVRQLQLARETGKPVIIHNRMAGGAILHALSQAGVRELRGVFHCFSENEEYARQVLALGCHVSFTGNLTYRKSALPEVARAVPLTRLLLETDCPFLAPVPQRGRRNEPAFMIHTAEKLAELHHLSVAEICRQTTRNAAQLFGLP
ncbi:MAG: TatD family hydrolase [candidate division KSB1 bacterium]|nr:TatD family hydrolase [candidate division KSB1 bacterium]MDZ7284732.1 TatD family hydrolase [candidate division KSB1 bacterium]MDZ7297849.1 TatD family hydrolase [candidate division KSB1 bacterium]MDZ7308759.1 TatD family hydrolase [candidate division KSB1 bacterium]MDZ7348714.1 TatD family hydrolase [candidate division KSB1 bacterium]